ncbi:MAG TPA: pyridoxine 5'-phosphate synthase [Phycisphaerae bacterium]|nr:pyridoxine 5'-phosphate synthase [Phycisphaerae bacterium]HPS52101.1 pyridoxine 5'-phosphate synthase [Phycisphaerae bacterium]
MIGLGVNIDHVATIRQARRTVEPDPVWAAAAAELGGASCITFHLRKDRRHINDRDAGLLRRTVRGKLNMEMSLDEEIVRIALELRPTQATLVPENRQEITTEGGLDVVSQFERFSEVTRRLNDAGIMVSAFIDPVESQIIASRNAGAQCVELHTGTLANAILPPDGSKASQEAVAGAFADVRNGLAVGLDQGLIVHAGHGITYQNVHILAALRGFTEFNIGHTIIARGIFTGLREAVAEMKRLIDRSQSAPEPLELERIAL